MRYIRNVYIQLMRTCTRVQKIAHETSYLSDFDYLLVKYAKKKHWNKNTRKTNKAKQKYYNYKREIYSNAYFLDQRLNYFGAYPELTILLLELE
jgi:hypothetical protein